MDIGKRMEQFNIAYLSAMAAQAGLNSSRPDVDDDSVDLQLAAKGWQGGKLRNPTIQLQLKCTAGANVAGEVIKFPLPRKNYDDLRGDDLICPRYLVVMQVPPIEGWIQHHPDHMSLHHTCYWVSIKDHPATDNTTSVTIDVPLSQRLTTETLKALLDKASNGEWA
ncbi:DUF4365 domain-containing protein [Variovorax soli]|jgi:hypothetical protein|uniref:DUF4365 domain-containing protein n=1 Tax=Variovorax soli TaxID=376815 RepID=UPI0008384F27|nr:DUF4365 domain-containing protein [Variovorax soli]